MGKFVFMMTWLPIIRVIFMLNKICSDDKGRSPEWLVRLLGAVFVGIWWNYDCCMKRVFGDGERTIEDDDDDDGKAQRKRKRLVKKRRVEVGGKEGWVDEAEGV